MSAVALVSVGYRSVSKRLGTEPSTPVAAAVRPETEPPLLRGLVQSTGLSSASFGFAKSSTGSEEPAEAGEMEAISSKTRMPTGETLRASVKAHATNIGIRVKRLVVTQAVEDREPVAVQEVSSSTPVIAFVEVATDGREDQNVVVTFEHETGDRVGLVNLNVPGNKSRWRTWGRTYDVNRDGRWTAVVRDSRGEELGRTAFTVRGTS